ncbi:MAG TPA: histidine ammonia-lyase [Spartobacteria bacterium]|nr:histidine ammonia-lyase [Spartobacteria bacterium]HCP90954.1 histidine ammonia-lyase [Spartobacteria bacterium]
MQLNGQPLALSEIAAVALGDTLVEVSPSAHPRVLASRKVIEDIIARDAVVYGVNTGFGKLADVRIQPDELRELQLNLVRSHACGIGNPLSEPEVRAMMLLRANVLVLGLSGVRLEIIEMLCQMLNHRLCPVIPEKGSVGASGDLASLAHLALSLIGEGESFFQGQRMEGREALRLAGLEPVLLEAKEGLALLNGTQAMHAVGGLSILRSKRLAHVADIAGAMSLEALKGTPAAFDPRLHEARPHPGQKAVASHLLSLLQGSEIRESHRKNDPRVQDAYSLRCMPQVHGAVRGVLSHCEDVLLIESGSATDNPLVFAENGDVISGGNFHGAPLAFALDYAAIAVTDLMSISERRIDRLVNPDLNESLPAFLARHPGTQSGFMIAHVAAVSLLSEAKVLAHPASIDNLPTSGGKEDHVSMGMTSALKLRSIVDLAENLLAIELLASAEALEHRRPLKAGIGVERAFAVLRKIAPPLTQDRSLSGDIARVADAIRREKFDSDHEKL